MEDKKILLTKEGLEERKRELESLYTNDRNEVALEIKAAREQGDLSENADYDAAKNRQAQIEARIRDLEYMIENAQIIEETVGNSRIVRLGVTVKIKDVASGDVEDYKIVGPQEADPFDGKISNESPLAVAILNQPVGAKVTVKAKNPYDVEIVSIG